MAGVTRAVPDRTLAPLGSAILSAMAMGAGGSGRCPGSDELTARSLLHRASAWAVASRSWVLLGGGLFAWLTILTFIWPYDPDEAVYKIVATGIFDGRWPYRDLFDHKPPMVYVWYLPAGLGATIHVQRILAALVLASSVPVFMIIARRMLTAHQTRLAGISYAGLLANPLMGLGANTEAFMLLPLLGAVAVRSPILSGALLGMAVMTKPIALAYVPVLILMRGRSSWRMLLATAAAMVAISLPFVPIWRSFLSANITFNALYGGSVSEVERVRNIFAFNPFVLLGALPVWIAAIAGALRSRHRTLLLWAACGFLAAKATGRDYGYYYVPLLPAAALLAGIGLEPLLASRRALLSTLAPAAAASVVAGAVALWWSWRATERYEPLAAAVRATRGETYVLGDDARVYAYASRQPSRRFFYSVPLAVNPLWGDVAREALLACPPATLVVPADPGSPFNVAWSADLERLYAHHASFAAGALFTEPRIVCAPPGADID